MRRIAQALVVIAVFAAAVPVAAQELPLRAFYGLFEGSGIAENRESLYFGVIVRDMDVRIGPDGAGFFVEWTTVIRSGGDPNNPDVRRRQTRIAFDPSDRENVFLAREEGDPLQGGAYIWARIGEPTLFVYVMTIAESGSYDIQHYSRSLSDTGMQLNFSRIRDGKEVLMVQGRLVKVAN